MESFRVGYHECLTEMMHFLVEKEGLYAGNSFSVRLMTHLQRHFDELGRGLSLFYHKQKKILAVPFYPVFFEFNLSRVFDRISRIDLIEN